MNEFQPWWTSKGVWGGVIAAAAPVAGVVLNVSLTGGDIDALAQSVATLGAAVTAGCSAVGGILAVYGRVKASRRIG